MNRYVLQRSETTPNGWVLTDTEIGIVMQFLEGRFNTTQRVTFLNNMGRPNPVVLERAVREMGDWLAEEKPEII